MHLGYGHGELRPIRLLQTFQKYSILEYNQPNLVRDEDIRRNHHFRPRLRRGMVKVHAIVFEFPQSRAPQSQEQLSPRFASFHVCEPQRAQAAKISRFLSARNEFW
jgi:hypothetical protein